MRALFKKHVLARVEDEDPFVRMAAIDTMRVVGAYGGAAKATTFVEQNKRSLVS